MVKSATFASLMHTDLRSKSETRLQRVTQPIGFVFRVADNSRLDGTVTEMNAGDTGKNDVIEAQEMVEAIILDTLKLIKYMN